MRGGKGKGAGEAGPQQSTQRGNGAPFTGCGRGGVNWVVSGGLVEMDAGGRDSPGDRLSVAFKGW